MIDGAEKAICESTVQFNVHVKPANTSEWPDNWQKNRTGATEQIDMTSSKYSGSHNRQFDINPVEKEDVELVGTYHPRFQIFHEYINGEVKAYTYSISPY